MVLCKHLSKDSNQYNFILHIKSSNTTLFIYCNSSYHIRYNSRQDKQASNQTCKNKYTTFQKVQWWRKTCATNNWVQQTEGHQFHLHLETYWCCL